MRTEEPRAIRLQDYRAPDFSVSEIALDFSLDPEATRVKATTQMARAGHGNAPLVLNGEHLKLVSLAIDGNALPPADYTLDGETLTIPDVPDRFTLEVVTQIAPASNTALEGLYLSKGMFCTQCEAEGFRRITYFLDRPDVLAVYTTRIEAPKRLIPCCCRTAIRSKRRSGRRPAFRGLERSLPQTLLPLRAGGGRSGRHARRIRHHVGTEGGACHLCRARQRAQGAYAMDSLKRAMKWDEEKYGREYDLDIFMIVAVSAFNMGAMENKGLNIFNDKVLLASPETATDDDYARIEGVVAHEYFHNWTGDRITCRDWFQLSLKEGLTVFRDQSFSADMRSEPVKRIEDVRALRLRQFQEDAGPLAHPVQPQSYITIDNFYTATVYEKGAEVIGMLKTLVGEEGYRKATDLYFERHDGQAATVEDWVKCFEDASGRDLTQFRLWYAQAGTPVIEAEGAYDAAKTYTLTLKQSLAATPGQPDKKPMHIPVRLGLVERTDGPAADAGRRERAGPDERVLELTEAEQTFIFVGRERGTAAVGGTGLFRAGDLQDRAQRQARAALMGRDADPFNRWEAGQALATDILLGMADSAKAGAVPATDTVYLEAIGEVLARAEDDPAFAALMLLPPLESELAMAMSAGRSRRHPCRARGADPRHRRGPRRTTRTGSIANSRKPATFSPDAVSAGQRACATPALRYLTAADDDAAAELADTHYRTATNMTDMIAGLAALSRMNSPRATPPSRISTTASAAIRWCSTNGWACRRVRPRRARLQACAR